MRWSFPLLIALASGCVAINPAYIEGDSGTSTGSTTQGAGSSGTATSAGFTTSADETDSDGSTWGSGWGSSTGYGSSSGANSSGYALDLGPGCVQTAETVEEDAFLVDCSECSSLNYGSTAMRFVGDALGQSVLLLRPPEHAGSVSRVDVTVYVRANDEVAKAGFVLYVEGVDAPCDWEPGGQDGGPLMEGESGVTWDACDANSNSSWDSRTVLDHADGTWSGETWSITAGDIEPGAPSPVTIHLEADGKAPLPDAFFIWSNVTTERAFSVFAAESEHPVELTYYFDCGL